VPPPPFVIQGAIEGESLVPTAQASSGAISVQDMETFGNYWSRGEQLWWRPTAVGATLTIQIPAPAAGKYHLTGYFTRARDYATIRLQQGGQNVGPELNMYSPNVVASGPIPFGEVTLAAGNNPFTIRITGRDPSSISYMVGIDAFVLTPL
jgi:hypothetical protein